MHQRLHSFSDDPKLWKPEGFTITVRQVKLSAAGFVVAITEI